MNRGRGKSGFTLIEIMVVLVIITILVGIVIGASKYAQTKAGTSRAKAEIAAMETALESFKSDNGYYPISTENQNNGTFNSILLYNNLTLGPGNNLTVGPKRYFTFKPNQLRDGHGTITFNINCPLPTGVTAVILTNVAIIDPFGTPYNYFNNPCGSGGLNNSATFDLWSYGPSGTNGDANMMTNWKQ